ncbi:membrane associated adenyl cyclase [Cryptosporidium canis]|uniref:Membrane associated adenyl cyclase n=1 Tax=Cryptosporidium canis TaxID=195482 RepID=A0A9D5HWV0_9CRYT|nr:membrane associated adenyl cyclase [Cryptosporidium canis]
MQFSHEDNTHKIYNYDLHSISFELSGNNIESLIRTGAILDFSILKRKSVRRTENNIWRCKLNVNKFLFKKESDSAKYFEGVVNGIKFLSTYQDFDIFDFSHFEEERHVNIRYKHSDSKASIRTHNKDILRLFDILINNIDQLKLTNSDIRDSKKPNLSSLTEELSASGCDTSNIDKYIIQDINNFFGFKKQTQYFSNEYYDYFNLPLIINSYYRVYTKLFVELIIQIIHVINIIMLRNRDISSYMYPCKLIIMFLALITIILDTILHIFNWNSTSKIGMVIEIIHLIFIYLCFCSSTYLNVEILNICALLLNYSYIYRIIFIIQCKYINIYNKFQVMEIIRTQLKQIFFSFDSEMSLMISSSDFEDICMKLGINAFYNRILVNKSLHTYLFQNSYLNSEKLLYLKRSVPFFPTKELSYSTESRYSSWLSLIIKLYYSYCDPILIKITCNFYKPLVSSKLEPLFGSSSFISFNLAKNITNKLKYIFKRIKKTSNITYQDFISKKKKITYEEFEMLLTSLDTDMKLLNKIRSSTNLFDMINGPCLLMQRKIIFEQSFYNITLFMCLSISVISIMETTFNYFSDFFQMNIFSNFQSYFYLFITIISFIFHYKIDKVYYNSSLKSYNQIKYKYSLIYGHLKFVENDVSSNKNTGNILPRSDYLSEFLSYRSAELLQNYTNSLSKYLPQGIAISILKRYDFASLNPQYKEITILFSDIVGFTNIAEKVNPFMLFQLLTNYFDEMIKIIEEFNGNLIEIVGDAILVIWNSPVALENHSVAAIAASLKMKKQLELESRSIHNNYLPKISIKCGIHTDYVLVGNIGCKKRIKYGIMGDGVNLASRIESLTKRYSADIIISNNVFKNKNVRNKFVICPLDVVVVQGKSNPTVIYHVLGTSHDSDLTSMLKSKFHTKALIFFINKDFERSLAYIEKINQLGSHKNDPTTINLFNKCKKLQDKKLDINWSCAEVLDDKYFDEQESSK